MFTDWNSRERVYFFCLALMACSIPLSVIGMSVSGLLMSLNWLFSKNLKEQIILFWQDKTAKYFLVFLAVYLFATLYSQDFHRTLSVIRVSSPLLLYPVVLSSSKKINSEQLKLLLSLFVAASLTSCLLSIAISTNLIMPEVQSFRGYSPLISHIRLSLCLVLSIAILSILLKGKKAKNLVLSLCAIALLLYGLNILQSATGFVILFLLILIRVLYYCTKRLGGLVSACITFLLLLTPILAVYFTISEHEKAKDENVIRFKNSALGEPYYNLPNNTQTENGHYIYRYIAFKELEASWNKRSTLNFYEANAKGHITYGNLIRFLASKNLRKDAAGLEQLSDSDIKAIEQGCTNYRFIENREGMYYRFYTLLFEYDKYKNKDYNGNSLMQRLVYVKTGISILKNNLVFGVGTGDLEMAFQDQYKKDKSPLTPENRHRAHNQYLSLALAFGLVGFLLIAFAFVYPIRVSKAYGEPVFCAFLCVLLSSFLAEDTLESQAGMSFFIFFYGIFVWAYPSKSAILAKS